MVVDMNYHTKFQSVSF